MNKIYNSMLGLLIIVLCILIVLRYTVMRENFSDDSEIILTDFLDTLETHTNEVNKIFTNVDDNKMKTDKALHFNNKANIVRGDDIVNSDDLGLYSQNKDDWMRFVTNNGSMLFNTNLEGDDKHGGNQGNAAMFIENNNGPIRLQRKVNVNSDLNVGGGLTVHGAKYIKVGNGSGGNENNWIKKNELCIGGVCINSNHLRVLRGDRDFNIYASDGNYWRFMDCGLKKDNQRVCYRHPHAREGWGNSWQRFRLRPHGNHENEYAKNKM